MRPQRPSTFLLCATIIATVGMMAAPTCATAGPFDPSYRGGPNSVHAIFQWVAPATNWNTSLFETGPSGFPLDPTLPETSDTSTDIATILPNFIDPLPFKLMRVQMQFDGAVDGSLIGMDVLPHDPQGGVAIEVDRSTGISNAQFIDWEIRPNPDWEEILIFGNTSANIVPGNLLTIEVDTISAPEPSTFLLAALGLLALLAYRRQHRR